MVLVCQGRGILIDCGVMFPDLSMLGIDLIIPNIEFLKEGRFPIDGIVLTHGHEDHIGAVSFLLPDLNYPPIFGSRFTLALVENRLQKHKHHRRVHLKPLLPPKSFSLGAFQLQCVQVTHSIVESMGLIIQTPIGTLVYSGDFKIDPYPADGKKIDSHTLKKVGNTGPLLLLSDSTNVEVPGWSRSELQAKNEILKQFKKIKSGKIIIAVFASNIHRIQHILEAAQAVKRKVALCGRSLYENTKTAKQLKLLHVKSDLIISPQEVAHTPPEKIVLIVTGTQAEPRSALYRMSLNNHPDIVLKPGDTVFLSSRHIPGNERAISHMINNLYRRGAEVIDSHMVPIHASGHAYQEEQKQLLKWVKPKFFLPIHGEYRMLVKHLQLAEASLPHINGLVAENGDILELTRHSFKKMGHAPAGKVFLDEAATDLHEGILKDRRKLAYTGLVVLSLVVDQEKGSILEGPHFDTRGVKAEIDLQPLKKQVIERFRQLSLEARKDRAEVEEELRRVTRRYFLDKTGTKPVVISIVYEV